VQVAKQCENERFTDSHWDESINGTAYIIAGKECCLSAPIAVEAASEDLVTVFKKASKISLDICWDKPDEYYQKCNESSVYPAAVVLYSGLK
jgi:hypothetical protein